MSGKRAPSDECVRPKPRLFSYPCSFPGIHRQQAKNTPALRNNDIFHVRISLCCGHLTITQRHRVSDQQKEKRIPEQAGFIFLLATLEAVLNGFLAAMKLTSSVRKALKYPIPKREISDPNECSRIVLPKAPPTLIQQPIQQPTQTPAA